MTKTEILDSAMDILKQAGDSLRIVGFCWFLCLMIIIAGFFSLHYNSMDTLAGLIIGYAIVYTFKRALLHFVNQDHKDALKLIQSGKYGIKIN